MRRHDHAHAGARQRIYAVPKEPARERIGAAGGLVEKQNLGAVDERARHAEVAPRAERQVLPRLVSQPLQAKLAQKLLYAPLQRHAADAVAAAEIL